jgi:N-acetylneuraminate synthase
MNLLKINIPQYCKMIAEIGINHNGDISLAKKLIDMAKNCGCDAVKFQKRTINIVYSQKFLSETRKSPWGDTQGDQKYGLEFTENEYDVIDKYCKKKEIEWFASAWDIKSLDFLDKYKPKNQKVASAMISNKEFLQRVAKNKIHTYISTGMTTSKMISEAIKIFNRNNCKFTLMHTVSTYPCPEDQLNLINIVKLKEKYNCKVGYSGHEPSVGPSIFAAGLGADCIERHITLDRAMYGSDQAASLEMNGLSTLVSIIRKLPSIIGTERKKILDIETNVAKKLRYWETF